LKSSSIVKSFPSTPKIVEMISITWNIRGLNSRGKYRYLKERLKKDKPNIMIVQETKISERKLKEIMEHFKLEYQVMS